MAKQNRKSRDARITAPRKGSSKRAGPKQTGARVRKTAGDPSEPGIVTVAAGTGSDVEAQANGSLIGAAPDLLIALQDCVRVLDSKEMKGVWAFLNAHGFNYSGPVIDMNAVRGAIAKAQGRA